MIDFLFLLPLWLLAVVLNVWLMGTALAGLWIARRWILPRLRLAYDDAYFTAAVVQSAMLLYSLIAALTAVGVWQKNSEVADIVSAEATAIASLWRDLGGYPQPQRDTTRDVLRGYTDQVIREAWPLQRQGRIPRQGVEWMDRLQAQLFAFEPATESQKIAHAETLRAFNNLVQQRRQRLESVQAGLPGVMWCVLLPGAIGLYPDLPFLSPREQALSGRPSHGPGRLHRHGALRDHCARPSSAGRAGYQLPIVRARVRSLHEAIGPHLLDMRRLTL